MRTQKTYFAISLNVKLGEINLDTNMMNSTIRFVFQKSCDRTLIAKWMQELIETKQEYLEWVRIIVLSILSKT